MNSKRLLAGISHKITPVFCLIFLALAALPGWANTSTVQYTYDDMQQIKKVVYDNNTTAIQYVYDNMGNRLLFSTALAGGQRIWTCSPSMGRMVRLSLGEGVEGHVA